MQLHSAYGACVGVKGNYAQPVYFPQLDDGYFLFFFYFPFVLKFNLGSVSFVRLQADSRVTNISDVKGKKKKKKRFSQGDRLPPTATIIVVGWWAVAVIFKPVSPTPKVFFQLTTTAVGSPPLWVKKITNQLL